MDTSISLKRAWMSHQKEYDDDAALAAVGGVQPFACVSTDEARVSMHYTDFMYNEFVSSILPRWAITRCYVRERVGENQSQRVHIDGAVQVLLDDTMNQSEAQRTERSRRDEYVLRQLKDLISSPAFDTSQLDMVRLQHHPEPSPSPSESL